MMCSDGVGIKQFIGCCDTLQWVGIEQLVGYSNAVATVLYSSVIVTVVLIFLLPHEI
jgi:hypothetical protein